MALSESLQARAYRELGEEVCWCGEKKNKGKSFCRRCYFSLPVKMQIALYCAEGYANTYDDAKEWLRINTDRRPKGKK
jgi:hypothetical protein